MLFFAPNITHVLAGKREGRGADRDAAEAVLEQRAQVEVSVQVRVDLGMFRAAAPEAASATLPSRAFTENLKYANFSQNTPGDRKKEQQDALSEGSLKLDNYPTSANFALLR